MQGRSRHGLQTSPFSLPVTDVSPNNKKTLPIPYCMVRMQCPYVFMYPRRSGSWRATRKRGSMGACSLGEGFEGAFGFPSAAGVCGGPQGPLVAS